MELVLEGKTCTRCKGFKIFSDFDKNKLLKDGHQLTCKECIENYRKANKEKISKREKEYKQRNKDKIAKQRKEYNRKNEDKISEYWKSENGRAVKYRSNLKRRSHKHKTCFKRHDRKQLLDRDNWTCQCCGIKVHDEFMGNWNTPTKAHIDHIVPISMGGDSMPKNLRVLCRGCNLTKGDKVNEQLRLNM